MRLPNALTENNNNAGYTVFNATNNTINITNPNNLSTYEKYAILSTHTGNVTFNSFAAEVEFHADYLFTRWADLNNWPILDDFYLSALRADMAVGEDDTAASVGGFYNLDSDIVQAQIEEHGEY